MAAGNRRKTITFKFELGLSGIFALGIVSFCIFLWMFLFGIWAGQTVLQSEGSFNFAETGTVAATDDWKNGTAEETASAPDDHDSLSGNGAGDEDSAAARDTGAEPETSYFCLQVAAFKDRNNALNSLLGWRAKGYDAFMQTPDIEAGDHFFRVFIGKYSKLAEANKFAARIAEEEEIKAFIALIPESRLQGPLTDNSSR